MDPRKASNAIASVVDCYTAALSEVYQQAEAQALLIKQMAGRVEDQDDQFHDAAVVFVAALKLRLPGRGGDFEAALPECADEARLLIQAFDVAVRNGSVRAG